MALMKELKKSFPEQAQAVLDAFLENPCCSEEYNKKNKKGGIRNG